MTEKVKPSKLRNLILGQVVFWRWHNSKSPFTEQTVLATNGNMIALGDSEYSRIGSWLHKNEIDLIVKDMSKGEI